jgi:DNA (cytosine-5)-methyltransferase 1
MRYLSVCAGIEAATVAWHPLGWTPAAFSEIEAFPRAVLAHHYPQVPCHGDFTTIGADEYGPIDLLVGGTPCQSFSVAGLRGGLDDDRGNLALEYLRLADRKRPRWLVWENVPGVLSSNGGRDFGAILGGMVELGYSFAYRVLDAQFFGVPQRRRRVFVVGHLGDWRRAAAVLFERHSLSGHPAPRREKGQSAPTIPSRSSAGGGLGTDFDCDGGLIPQTVGTLKANNGGGGWSNSADHAAAGYMIASIQAGALRENPESGPDGAGIRTDGQAYTLEARAEVQAVAFMENQRGELRMSEAANLTNGGGKPGQGYPATLQGSAVRRLTPRECERLQGFPDDYTLVPYRGKPAADGPRYKALGNSMAVPVMRWIGERIEQVEALSEQRRAA